MLVPRGAHALGKQEMQESPARVRCANGWRTPWRRADAKTLSMLVVFSRK